MDLRAAWRLACATADDAQHGVVCLPGRDVDRTEPFDDVRLAHGLRQVGGKRSRPERVREYVSARLPVGVADL